MAILAGTGLLATTTGLLGVGVLTASTSGALTIPGFSGTLNLQNEHTGNLLTTGVLATFAGQTATQTASGLVANPTLVWTGNDQTQSTGTLAGDTVNFAAQGLTQTQFVLAPATLMAATSQQSETTQGISADSNTVTFASQTAGQTETGIAGEVLQWSGSHQLQSTGDINGASETVGFAAQGSTQTEFSLSGDAAFSAAWSDQTQSTGSVTSPGAPFLAGAVTFSTQTNTQNVTPVSLDGNAGGFAGSSQVQSTGDVSGSGDSITFATQTDNQTVTAI